jgi:hypothetical protein
MANCFRRLGLARVTLINSARTAVAAVVSLLLARSLKLPEFYWAPISTVVILLSPTNPLTLAWQRFAGTALGGVMGALIATYFGSRWVVYGAGIFVCGIICALLRLGGAYRFAAITLTIVPADRPPASDPGSSPSTATWKSPSESLLRCWSLWCAGCHKRKQGSELRVTAIHHRDTEKPQLPP